MKPFPKPLDLRKVKVYPLKERRSLSSIEKLVVDPQRQPSPLSAGMRSAIGRCAKAIRNARDHGSSVMLIYGAHLIKNGAMQVVISLLQRGWITHLATNGAGTIHDWELSYFGRTEESVRQNVATGTFGTWQETGRNIHLALLAAGLKGEGYGRGLGRFIAKDGTRLPAKKDLEKLLKTAPANRLAGARADALQAIHTHKLPEGRIRVKHPWKKHSILCAAFNQNVPFTVHPGIGYDIISNHPMFNGAVIGRAAELDFRLFGTAVEGLDGGVVLSVGSAIMGPQVFEKSLSTVNNLRLQAGREIVRNHSICVVDLQDGGNWDWSKGEPPKDNPAYYLRFCKSFARMGGEMKYVQCDNVAFLHNLLWLLEDEFR